MWSAYVYDYTQTTVTPICFYASVSPDLDVGLISPKLSLKKNEAGSFTFTLPPTNRGNEYIRLMTSLIEIKKDDAVFWRGRVIAEERDCYDQRKITCEGGQNFLLDTIQLPMHVNGGILTWLQYLLTTDYHDSDAPEGQYHRCHNYFFNSTETFKKFNIAYFDPNIELSANADWYANYETTSELVNNVLEAYDIKMEVTFENGVNNLWFYKNYPSKYQSMQQITFGKNLIKYTRNWDVEELATVIIPTGSKVEADEERPTIPYTPPDLDAVETIQSVNSGSVFLEADSDIIARYGRIYKKIEWNDISQPSNLLDLAQNYFDNYQFDKLTIEVELYDLSIMMTGSEKEENELHLLGTVECVSKPHGLDKWFPITEIEYDFVNPGNTKYVLGDAIDSTMSGTLADSNTQLNNKIDNNISSSSEIYNMVDAGIINKVDEEITVQLQTDGTIHDFVLSNCYSKAETYTQNEVDQKAADAAQTYYTNNITGSMASATAAAVEQAGTNATNMIKNVGVGSYVIFVHDPNDATGQKITELVISNTTNYTSNTAKVWRWNSGGLGYSSTGYNGTYGTAITADGTIVGSYIATGSMDANRIQSGTFTADYINGGTITSLDSDAGGRHNMVLNLTNGHFFAKNLALEPPSSVVCQGTPSDAYIYLGTADWNQASIWSNGSTTVSVGGYTSGAWRCILGSHFGVTSDGVVACNYMKAGNVLVGGDFVRTITAQGNLGNSGTFLLSGTNSGTLFTSGSEGTYAVAGTSRSDWRLSVGNNFGVTEGGILYSNQGHFVSATVDGTVNAAVFSAFTMAYGNTSQYFGSSVVQNDATSQIRYIVLKVTGYGSSGGYPYCNVAAFVESTTGTTLNESYRLQFYIGTFDPLTSPYNVSKFVKNVNTVFEITVPSGTTESSPVTKRCQGVSSTYGAYACRAVYIKTNYDSNYAAYQRYADPLTNGFADRVSTQYVISGTRHNAVQFNCSLAPVAQMDGQELLGGVGNMWKQLYATSGSIYTSARMRKYDITGLTDNFDIFFDRLRPVSFRMKKEDDKRKHNGFVLDEVAEALAIAEIPKDDFAGYEEFKSGDELGDGGLRYSEFIAINTDQIQKAKKRISELEERIAALERGNL